MDKSKGRWQATSYEDSWDYISSKPNVSNQEWDNARSSCKQDYRYKYDDPCWDNIGINEFGGGHLKGGMSEDSIVFQDHMKPSSKEDVVNNPAHYQFGSLEAIDIIEGAITHAPEPVTAMLQAQVLKYLLRMWHKDKPAEDAKKAQWYLNRLVDQL